MIGAVVADPGAQMAMIQAQIGEKEHDESADMRKTAEKQEVDADQHAVDAMNDKADSMVVYGIVGGAVDVASAGCTLGAASTMSTDGKTTGATKWLSFSGKMADIGSKELSMVGAQDGVRDDRDADVAKSNAQQASRQVDNATQYAKDSEDAVQKALDFYKDWETTNAQTMQAGIRA